MNRAVLHAAHAWASAGASVVPTRTDGSKAPAAFWKAHQARRATAEEVNAWLSGGAHDGIGVITGSISASDGQYLEMFEFEGRAVDEGLVQQYVGLLNDHGLEALWLRVTAGYLERTPSGGVHLLYRVKADTPRGNTKLARRPSTPEELHAWKAQQQQDIDATYKAALEDAANDGAVQAAEMVRTKRQAALKRITDGAQVPQVLIETRGEGGYTVVAPSGGRTHPTGGSWTLLQGGPDSLAVLTEDERDALHDLAEQLDAMPAVEVPETSPARPQGPAGDGGEGKRPGDAFNEHADWAEILEPHGWRQVQSFGDGASWCRPGKSGHHVSATTGRNAADNLYVFSSSTLFEPEQPYSKFAAWTLLEHGGNYGAAARELSRRGYGDPAPRGDENLTGLIADYDPAKHGPFSKDNPKPGITLGIEGNLATVHQIRPEAAGPSYGRELHRGQLRFAHRFTGRWDGEYLHVHGLGWHRYDGARWAECLDGGECRAVLALIDEAFAELPRLDGDTRKELFKDIGKVESSSGVRGVLDLAANMHPCTLAGQQLDADPILLNTKNGTVHLDTARVSAPQPTDHLSKVTRASFNPDARSAVFDEFLQRVQPDEEMRAFLARQLGSALLGVVREHVLPIWHGTGANGKGTLRDAILHALGDYAVEVPADLLLVTRNANLAPERMRLKGARVAFCSEIGHGAKLDEAIMKKLTGGDPVNAKMLYRNPIQFDPSHTLFMLTNHLPQVRGDDPATWRRILAVPFDTVIPPEERDGKLPEKLKAVPDAVLAWMWAGWLDYQQQGLNPPESVRAATRAYRHDSDVLARFLEDEDAIVLGHGSVRSSDLYRAFVDWCRIQGEDAQMSNKAFSEAMTQRGHRRKKTSAGMAWEHIMIASENGHEGE